MMPLNRDECVEVLKVFLERHPDIENKLDFIIAENDIELYGKPANIMAGYSSYPEKSSKFQGRVSITASKFHEKQDLYMAINHEVLGHYGLNTFSPRDKKLLLDTIIANKDQDDFKLQWKEIEAHYGDKNIYEQAEEIFAIATEDIYPYTYPKLEQINEKGTQAFDDVCYFKQPLTQERLFAITDMVALGIRENTRQQQTFAENDITLLSRQTMHQEPDDPEPEMTM